MSQKRRKTLNINEPLQLQENKRRQINQKKKTALNRFLERYGKKYQNVSILHNKLLDINRHYF